MAIILGLIGLLALGIGATLFVALLRWLFLIGIAILCGLGALSAAVGALVFFSLYQFYGPEYGALITAMSIAAALISAKQLFLSIATELGIRRNKVAKEVPHGH